MLLLKVQTSSVSKGRTLIVAMMKTKKIFSTFIKKELKQFLSGYDRVAGI